MLELQRTIAKPVSLSGIGLHTGTSCTMTFVPAPENSGIKFVRVDLGGKPEIPANADFVVDISRGTTLGLGTAKVFTVEHVLAAIVGLQIDNITIELDGIEPPIGDGSALPYVEKLIEAGIIERQEQDAIMELAKEYASPSAFISRIQEIIDAIERATEIPAGLKKEIITEIIKDQSIKPAVKLINDLKKSLHCPRGWAWEITAVISFSLTPLRASKY